VGTPPGVRKVHGTVRSGIGAARAREAVGIATIGLTSSQIKLGLACVARLTTGALSRFLSLKIGIRRGGPKAS